MSSPIYNLNLRDESAATTGPLSIEGAGNPPLTSKEIYEELCRHISFQYDRFKDTRTYTMQVAVTPLNHRIQAQAELVFFIASNQEKFAALRLRFMVKGALKPPAPGTPVDWLFAGARAESFVLSSNGQTVSSTFRIGTDVMPGPLSVFVSMPVTNTKSSIALSINIPADFFAWMEKSDAVDFRIGGMEYRLSGHWYGTPTPAPLAECAQALRAMAEQAPARGALLAMRHKTEREKSRKTRRVWLTIGACLLLGIMALTVIGGYNSAQQRQESQQLTSPSPNEFSSTPTPSPRSNRRRK